MADTPLTVYDFRDHTFGETTGSGMDFTSSLTGIASAGSGNTVSFPPSSSALLYFENTTVSPRTITFTGDVEDDQGNTNDYVVIVPAQAAGVNGQALASGFSPTRFGLAGKVLVQGDQVGVNVKVMLVGAGSSYR